MIAVAIVCIVALLIIIPTAIMIVLGTVLKKKKGKSSKEQEHDVSIYESISDVFTESMKCDRTPNEPSDDNVYDEIKAIYDNTTQFELMENKAYSSFKPQAVTEVLLKTESAGL